MNEATEVNAGESWRTSCWDQPELQCRLANCVSSAACRASGRCVARLAGEAAAELRVPLIGGRNAA